jgi:hypothetical protein
VSPTAQIIISCGVTGLLLLRGLIGVIWALRCDPRKPHYRLPAAASRSGPVMTALLAFLKAR